MSCAIRRQKHRLALDCVIYIVWFENGERKIYFCTRNFILKKFSDFATILVYFHESGYVNYLNNFLVENFSESVNLGV